MDPNSAMVVAVVVLFATMALNRFVGERNYRQLTDEQKLALIDRFSSYRSRATYVSLVAMGAVILLALVSEIQFKLLFPIGITVILAYTVLSQASAFDRLSELDLPDDFVLVYRVQATTVLAFQVVAMCLLTYGFVSRS